MSEWDGRERRKVDPKHEENAVRLAQLHTQVELLDQKLDNLAQRREEIHSEVSSILKDHTQVIYAKDGLLAQSSAIDGIRKDLQEHTTQDKWVQGSMLTALLAILGKLFGFIK